MMALCQAIKEFVLENCMKVNKWSGSEDGSGAAAYFQSATTPDKLKDFSSLEGGVSSGGAPSTSSGGASKPSGPAGALAGEIMAMATPLLNELKAKADAIGNASVTQGTDFYLQAMKLQGALLSTMASFRKPSDVAFVTNGSPVV